MAFVHTSDHLLYFKRKEPANKARHHVSVGCARIKPARYSDVCAP